MVRLTDVDIKLTFTGINLQTIDETPLYVTIKQNGKTINLNDIEIGGTDTMYCHLSQRDTQFFGDGEAKIQVNYWINGDRKATKWKTIDLEENLLNRVVEVND